MIRLHPGLLLLVLLPALLAAADKKPAPAPGASLARLSWLAGNWRLERAGRVTDEQWMLPAGGVMLGMSRTVAKGRVAEQEFLQIREGPGGELFYITQPVRQTEAAFRLLSQSDTEVVFENRERDFPQVVGYRLNPDGSVLAWIEGPRSDGTTRRVEHLYLRVRP
jgi:hypothetical protein